jgi:hypothetical protein
MRARIPISGLAKPLKVLINGRQPETVPLPRLFVFSLMRRRRHFRGESACPRVGLRSVSQDCGNADEVIPRAEHQRFACGFDSLHRSARPGWCWERKKLQGCATGQFIDIELFDAVLRLCGSARMPFGEVVVQHHDEGVRMLRFRRSAPEPQQRKPQRGSDAPDRQKE